MTNVKVLATAQLKLRPFKTCRSRIFRSLLIEDILVATTSDSQRRLTIAHSIGADGITTLICKGRINVESAGLFRNEVKALSSSHKTVLADLSGVESIDSSGLGSILGTHVSAKNEGCELILVNVNPGVRDLLNITKLTSVLAVR